MTVFNPHEDVLEFYKGFKLNEFIATHPGFDNISLERLVTKMELIAEEFIELVVAVFSPRAGEHLKKAWKEALLMDDGERDLVETADALADLIYVIENLAIELGIPLPEVFHVVHESNMSKLDENGEPIISDGVTPSAYDGEVKPLGKVLKSDQFFEPTPEIEKLLREKGAPEGEV